MSILITIFLLSLIITLGVCYLSMHYANSEEAKLVNEIQIKYPNNARYYG